jgi:dTDP-4-amino-4,6-dideoxygalactose transaminase
MSEFNAALGLIQLEGIDRAISARKELYESYLSELANIRGIRFIDSPSHCLPNYSYCPIMVGPDFLVSRDKLYEILKSNGVYSRKYFYPLISNFPMYSHLESSNKEHLKNANIASEQILCLPIYSELEKKSVRDIASIIKGAKN